MSVAERIAELQAELANLAEVYAARRKFLEHKIELLRGDA